MKIRRYNRNSHKVEHLTKRINELEDRYSDIKKENSRLQKELDIYKDIGKEFDAIYAEYKKAIESAEDLRKKYKDVLVNLAIMKKEYEKQIRELIQVIR